MLNKIDMKHARKTVFDGIQITTIKRPKGFGDTVEQFLHTGVIGLVVHKLTGLDGPCGACQKRRDKLNAILPYKK